jgi:hypothetical protein
MDLLLLSVVFQASRVVLLERKQLPEKLNARRWHPTFSTK